MRGGGARGGRRGEQGFTLLELLVGIVVLGFILLGLGQGVRFGMRAADTQARLGAGRNELDVADRLLRRLIEGAEPGTERTPASLAGTAGEMVLVAALPQGAGGGLGDVAVGVGGGRLVLRWTPHRHAVPLGPLPAPREAELLRGVAAVQFAYWDGAAWQGSWSGKTLPGLVRVRILFPAGDVRRWPDIVAAPVRGRAGPADGR